MKKYVLGLGGALTTTAPAIDATNLPSPDFTTVESLSPQSTPVQPELAKLGNVMNAQHVVHSIGMPTQEAMTFDQLENTGKAFSDLINVLGSNDDAYVAAENVLNTIKGSKAVVDPADRELLTSNIIDTVVDAPFIPETSTEVPVADESLENQYGWHTTARAMTCFHEAATTR